MNYVTYFSDKGLDISITADDNLKIQGLSSLQDDLRIQVLQYAQENKWCIVFEIQTQDKTLQQKIDTLWKKATILADWIDNSESNVSWQKRAAKIQEIQKMSEEIDRLEARIDLETATKHGAENRLNSLEGFSPLSQLPVPKQYHQENCPARCKRIGRCYDKVYFFGKPGKPEPCKPDQCQWNNQLKTNGKCLPEFRLKI